MFEIKFETGNSAFDDQPASEVARILRDIAKRVERGEFAGLIRDANGNTVGKWRQS